MKPQRPTVMYGLIAASCIMGFALEIFSFSGSAEASRNAGQTGSPTDYRMPTGRDLVIFERRLRKATRDSRFANTCGRGQLIGNATVHVAMHFPPLDAVATKQTPGFARAHASQEDGTPKALVLDSKDPTLWTVSGKPSVIVLTGKAVVADYPAGTPIFAPRFATGCGKAAWANLPRNWNFPHDQSVLSSLVDNVKGRFDSRAQMVAKKLFDRPAASWEARRGNAVIAF